MNSLRREIKTMARLAWPVILGQIGLVLMGTVDLAMVGVLGEQATAAVALGNAWHFALFVLGLGFASGCDSAFTQAFGAERPRVATSTLYRGGLLLALLSLPLALGHLLAGPGLTLLRQPAAIIDTAATYAGWVGLTIPFGLGFSLMRQYLQGDGKMLPPTLVVLGANLVNIAANAWFIHGGLGVPALGVTGVAVATGVSRVVMFLGLLALVRPVVRAHPPLPEWLSFRELVKLARTALPVSVQHAVEVWAFLGVTFMVGLMGETAIAAHAISLNLASLSFMVPMGVGVAAATRVGNLVGAGEDWRLSAWTSVGIGAAVMVGSAALFATLPGWLVSWFTQEPGVVAVAVGVLPVAAAFQLFDGVQVVSFGVLRGAGDTRVPALYPLLGFWLLGLPTGAALGFVAEWGVQGVWLGLTLGLSVVAALLLVRIRTTLARGATLV